GWRSARAPSIRAATGARDGQVWPCLCLDGRLTRISVVAIELPIRRQLPAGVSDARERGFALLGSNRARDLDGSCAVDPPRDLVVLLDDQRRDDIGRKANGEAAAPSLDAHPG